jgi:hypothetical protein
MDAPARPRGTDSRRSSLSRAEPVAGEEQRHRFRVLGRSIRRATRGQSTIQGATTYKLKTLIKQHS